jgi:hypothetical protein
MIVIDHPIQLTGQYLCMTVTNKPEDRVKGAMMNAVGKKSMAE